MAIQLHREIFISEFRCGGGDTAILLNLSRWDRRASFTKPAPTLPPWRRAALPEPEPGGTEPGNPSPSINDITSRSDQHGGSFDQPPGMAQQSVGATIPRSTTRAHVRLCNFMFGYPASANRLFAASVFRRVPSGSVASRSLSCCGNILWFEKCNTSEYAAGGHRPTRSDAAKRVGGLESAAILPAGAEPPGAGQCGEANTSETGSEKQSSESRWRKKPPISGSRLGSGGEGLATIRRAQLSKGNNLSSASESAGAFKLKRREFFRRASQNPRSDCSDASLKRPFCSSRFWFIFHKPAARG
ncbi:unnamed protein product [Nesidiocoris tenuis]|uniref:Uncharacterized protein n=1 Tax=Nesidiocoris tenuis TaxID=355587 RepID=A0A6H5H128_9HEMI|nr:unnamed protein product [Nesidiocoris tenuis]